MRFSGNKFLKIAFLSLFLALLSSLNVITLHTVIPVVIGIIAFFVITDTGGRTNRDLFELQRLVCIVVLIIFSISPVIRIISGNYLDLDWEHLITAELIALFGLISYLAGYRLASINKYNGGTAKALKLFGQPSNSGLFVMGYLLLAIELFALLIKRYPYAGHLASAGAWDNILSVILSFGNVLLFVISFRILPEIRTFKTRYKAGWLVIFLANLLLALISGWKGQVLIVLLTPLISYYYATKKFAVTRFIVALSLFAALVYPAMSLYRGQEIFQDLSNEQSPGMPEFMDTWKYVLQENVLSENSSGSIYRILPSVIGGRTDMIEPLTRISSMTHIPSDLLYGKTISLFFISLSVPRFIWADKPEINIGKWFGYKFGYVDTYGSSSIAMTLPGEFFLNFWWIGVVVGMTLIGCLHGIVYKSLAPYNTKSEFALSLYFICMLILANIQSSFAISHAGLLKQLLVWTVIWHVFVKLFPQKAAAHK